MPPVASRRKPGSEFFQEDSIEALKDQARRALPHLGFEKPFFARLVRMEERRFEEWLQDQESLSSAEQDDWRAFWRLMLHLLPLQNSDPQRVKDMLDAQVAASPIRLTGCRLAVLPGSALHCAPISRRPEAAAFRRRKSG